MSTDTTLSVAAIVISSFSLGYAVWKGHENTKAVERAQDTASIPP
jgi:hypothetical protein